jgi:hypothetical protein
VTPTLPKRGRQPKGSIPLPPLLPGFFINLLMIIAILGDARAAGAEARCAKNPQERLLVSLQDFNRAPITAIFAKKLPWEGQFFEFSTTLGRFIYRQ